MCRNSLKYVCLTLVIVFSSGCEQTHEKNKTETPVTNYTSCSEIYCTEDEYNNWCAIVDSGDGYTCSPAQSTFRREHPNDYLSIEKKCFKAASKSHVYDSDAYFLKCLNNT